MCVAQALSGLTVQALTPDGLRNLGPSVEHMAAVEGLDAHKRAVSLRLAALSRTAAAMTVAC
jgi:histidinol dehydrogenase